MEGEKKQKFFLTLTFFIHSFKILVKMTILYVYILIGDEVLWMQKLSQ